MLRLFTTAYSERDPARRAEHAVCLAHNLACSAIAEICLLVEGEDLDLPESPAIRTREIEGRPAYGDFFVWISEVAGPEDFSIIANSDIYFDGSLRLLDRVDLRDRCLALSRWDVLKGGRVRLFERGDSQDCWIFRGPVRAGVKGDFPLGAYDCDNKIAWELERAGYRVSNPAFSLRSYHLHQGPSRSYDPASPADHGIRPPFRYLEPGNEWTLFECWRLWRELSPGYFPWRFTWRKFLRTGVGRIGLRLAGWMKRRLSGKAAI
jgi:hypothetical protein